MLYFFLFLVPEALKRSRVLAHKLSTFICILE